MKFSASVSSLLLFAASAFATVPASFDNTYDNADGSMETVACSNLATSFATFGNLPTFPNIGGASAIAGFGSANCGTCWSLTFAGTGNTIIVTAIDHAGDGFNLSQEALDTLTNGQAVQDGVVQVTAEQVDSSQCGL
ncbi:hypothetical protein M0805_001660 [Coniferiporia weirii]|nr:hypothetical protein M0805_001660 [Coniferiporia weirii]